MSVKQKNKITVLDTRRKIHIAVCNLPGWNDRDKEENYSAEREAFVEAAESLFVAVSALDCASEDALRIPCTQAMKDYLGDWVDALEAKKVYQATAGELSPIFPSPRRVSLDLLPKFHSENTDWDLKT